MHLLLRFIRRPGVPLVALISILFLAFAADAEARLITLAWDASPDQVSGYRVSYGTTPGNYTTTVDVGNVLTWQTNLPGAQYYFAVRAYDASGNLSPFSLEVGDAAGVALTNPGDQSDPSGSVVNLPLTAVGSPVTYSATNLPAGLTINATTGVISGTITAASGSSLVTARVTDTAGNISSVQFTWTVTVNRAPVVTNPGTQSSLAGSPDSLAISASDPDGDTLSYSASGLPTGLSINTSSGAISGTITAAAGTYNVTVTVSDGVASTPVSFSWVVSV